MASMRSRSFDKARTNSVLVRTSEVIVTGPISFGATPPLEGVVARPPRPVLPGRCVLVDLSNSPSFVATSETLAYLSGYSKNSVSMIS